MKRLIVNADDFGLCEGANLGILRAHHTGIVTSATVMLNMPGAVAALEAARFTPTLGVGVHLTLTGGRPLCPDVPTLTGPDGRFLRMPALMASASPAELERELRAQVAAFLASGLRPTHLDSHHHVHLEMPAVGEIVRRLGAELGVPVRAFSDHTRFTDRFYGAGRVGTDDLIALLESIAEGETLEIMCHPAYLDPELLAGSSYAVERVRELTTLTSPEVWAAVEARQIALINYCDLL